MAKKIKAPDFTAYIWRDHKDLDPEYIKQCKAFLAQLPRANPFQATSSKPQAASDKLQALTNLNKGLYRIKQKGII